AVQQSELGELSQYFLGPYVQGHLYEGTQYSEDSVGELLTFRYDAADGPVQVWQHAFDLREMQGAKRGDGEDLIVLYHYTNELAFQVSGLGGDLTRFHKHDVNFHQLYNGSADAADMSDETCRLLMENAFFRDILAQAAATAV
ncbi:HPGDS, partial [Symbiodinium natans]